MSIERLPFDKTMRQNALLNKVVIKAIKYLEAINPLLLNVIKWSDTL